MSFTDHAEELYKLAVHRAAFERTVHGERNAAAWAIPEDIVLATRADGEDFTMELLLTILRKGDAVTKCKLTPGLLFRVEWEHTTQHGHTDLCTARVWWRFDNLAGGE